MATPSSVVTRKENSEKNNGDSVVTLERYRSGMTTFDEWMNSIEKNAHLFQRHYDEFNLQNNDIETFKNYISSDGIHALIIGEDWCPDVWRGLPVACALAEQTGMELRLFERDKNSDIMSEFLKDGEFESIPVIVFYNESHEYLGHWMERSDLANSEMSSLVEILHGKERGTPEWDEARELYLNKQWEVAEGWRQSQISELIDLLNNALS